MSIKGYSEKLVSALMGSGIGDISLHLSREIEDVILACDSPLDAYEELFNYVADRLFYLGEPRTCIFGIPFQESDEIRLWDGHYNRDSETPLSIYLHTEENFLIDATEEYRRYFQYNRRTPAVFRSWRDALFEEKRWPFNNCLFFYKHVLLIH